MAVVRDGHMPGGAVDAVRRLLRRRTAVVVALVMGVVLMVGADAQASTLTRVGVTPRLTFWTYTAESGVTNNITIDPGSGTRFVLTDTAETITVDDGQICAPSICPPLCNGTGTHSVDCATANSLRVNAGTENDTVHAGSALTLPLLLNGQDGTDQLRGGASSDVIDGGAGNDTELNGQGGDDTILGGAGLDTGIAGGTGTDILSYDDGRTTGVTASLTSGANSDSDTFSSMEILSGSGQADILTGTASANQLNGLGGDDVLIGGAGADSLFGGDGTDTASYDDGRTAGVVAALGGSNSDGDTYNSISNLTGSPGDDQLTGDGAANMLSGGGGDDELIGGEAADTLIGGAGRNSASYRERATDVTASLAAGGLKPDGDIYTEIQSLRGGTGDDMLTGDGADNTLDGGPGDDLLIGAGSDDDLIGGGGRNTASYEERATAVSASLAPDGPKPDSDVYLQIENLRGGSGNDTLTGDASLNTLDGGPGSDVITGGSGFDELRGAAGGDTLNARDGAPDAADCGAGSDTANVDVVDERVACELVRLPDTDDDGFDSAADCDDANPAVNPRAQEIPDNAIDENCDGILGVSPVPDRDGDGFDERVDCDDLNAGVHPGALEIPGNAIDENCDRVKSDFSLVGASIAIFVKSTARSTRVTELTISAIPAGGRVEIRCRPPKGKRRACPFTRVRRSFPRGRRRVNLVGAFKHRRLPLGTVVEVRVVAPGTIGKVRIERVRRSKTTRRLLCLRPGATRATRCPNS